MKKRILAAAGILIVVIAAVLCIWHRAAYMVYQNLTAHKLTLDESRNWTGGNSYLGIPYASDSHSQYLDLYVPFVKNAAGGVASESGAASDSGAEAGDCAAAAPEMKETPPLLIIVHGGGVIAGDSQTRQAQLMYRYFRDHGYACATVNYRLAQEAPFPAGLEDVKAAVRFLRSHADEYGYDASRAAIFGESAGGYLASMTAVTNDNEYMNVRYVGQKQDEAAGEKVSAAVNVLVDYYGAVELTGLTMHGDDWKKLGVPQIVVDIANGWASGEQLQGYPDVESFWMRKDLTSDPDNAGSSAADGSGALSPEDARTYVRENLNKDSNLAVVIIHGDCDLTVPVLQSQRFYETVKERLGEERTQLLIIPGEGHAADMLYADDVLEKVDAFVRRHM